MDKRKVLDEITLEYYPNKLTSEQFGEEIQDGIRDFVNNMMNEKEMWVEEWAEMFIKYMEMK